MKKTLLKTVLFLLTVAVLLCITSGASAKIEWEFLQDIPVPETPKDIALTKDAATAYILGTENIHVYSFKEQKFTDTIPVQNSYSNIALTPEGDRILLTREKDRSLSIIEISEIFDLPIGDSAVIGNRKARVSVSAFLDYQCPYCARIFPVLEQLLKKYPDSINVVIKQFPLRSHKFSRHAARASLAAARQDKCLEMSKLLFKEARRLNDTTIRKQAETAGLDLAQFDRDYKDPALEKIINRDYGQGRKAKVRGVPAIFVNGKPAKRARSLPALSKMIDKALK